MTKSDLIKTLKQWGISKTSGNLGYEAAKGILVYNVTSEEYERRLKIVANYLKV